jgi:predicted transcriptional regulator with HTH domain
MTEFKRRPVRGAQVNQDLPPPPTHAEIARAIVELPEHDPRARRLYGGTKISANLIAQYLKVPGARRSGRGAVKGSWSGTMSGALRVAPALRSMIRLGFVTSYRENHYTYYELTDAGKVLAESVERETVSVTERPSPSRSAGWLEIPGGVAAALNRYDRIYNPGRKR